jgi:hypothetical protein
MGTAMFSLRQLSEQIDALNKRSLSLADFEDWFVSESWGSYDVAGGDVSNAIAVVHQVLHSYNSDEVDENGAVQELATAIFPFVEPVVSITIVRPNVVQVLKSQGHSVYLLSQPGNENIANPLRTVAVWGTLGSSNSTIPPQRRETASTWEISPSISAETAAA